MKVLLLGKKGMLGHELDRVFQSDELISLDQPEIDLGQPKTITDNIVEHRPDVVVNAVAYTDVDGSEEHADLALQLNGEAVGPIAKATKAVGGIVIHYSTDYVFDGTKKEGYNEDAKPNPVNLYGKSKALGEEYLMRETDAYYLIRTSSLFGVTGKHFVRTILEAAKTKDALEVVNDQLMKPSFARDVAKQTRHLLTGSHDFGIYHVTNEPATSWYAFAKHILKQAGLKTNVSPSAFADLDRPARRPQYSILLNTKLPPHPSWKEALETYFRETS